MAGCESCICRAGRAMAQGPGNICVDEPRVLAVQHTVNTRRKSAVHVTLELFLLPYVDLVTCVLQEKPVTHQGAH